MPGGRRASRKQIRAAEMPPKTATPIKPGPRRSSRAEERPEPPGIGRAAHASGPVFTGATDKGAGYNVRDLSKLFVALTGNPRITVAKVQNLGNAHLRDATVAIDKFADGLPGSRLVAANLGEYTADAATWQHLLQAIGRPECILGHLYVSEPHISNNHVKNAMIAALRHNRTKPEYRQRTDTNTKRYQIMSANCWYSPKLLAG